MTVRLVVAALTGTFVLTPLAAHAGPIPPACVVVDAAHVQAGYAPNGPSDCTHL